MVVEKYGVTLRRLTRDKIELVRTWRSDPKIAQYMEFQDHITPEMQSRWFEKINNDQNYFFILEFQGKEVGLVNVKDIDYELKQGEGGIFIYDDTLLNSTISFQAALAINDFCFETLGFEQMIAHIRSDNKRAIQYNKFLGYQLLPNQHKVLNQLYGLSRECYFEKRKRIARLINF